MLIFEKIIHSFDSYHGTQISGCWTDDMGKSKHNFGAKILIMRIKRFTASKGISFGVIIKENSFVDRGLNVHGYSSEY